jgi:DNA polymerase elongation subunit (family B)
MVIFSEYVQYFYSLRIQYKADKNTIGDKFAKMMLNSLYGKFGQRSSEWVELNADTLLGVYAIHKLPLPGCYENVKGLPRIGHGAIRWQPIGLPHPVTIRRFGGRLEIKCDRGEHWESSPIIAANITALARTRLRYLIGKAGKGNVFYCDTDSLFVNRRGFDKLRRIGEIDSKILGKLKLEDESICTEIRCPKDYTFAGNIVIKGIRKNAIPIGPAKYRQQSFEGIKSVLRRNGEKYIRIGWIEKQLSRTYSKGIVRPNGWVDFIELNESE